MNAKEVEIIKGIMNVLPKISESGRERLLGFVTGIAFIADRDRQAKSEDGKSLKPAA